MGISFEIYLRSTCEFGTLQGIQPHALSKSDKKVDGMRVVLECLERSRRPTEDR